MASFLVCSRRRCRNDPRVAPPSPAQPASHSPPAGLCVCVFVDGCGSRRESEAWLLGRSNDDGISMSQQAALRPFSVSRRARAPKLIIHHIIENIKAKTKRKSLLPGVLCCSGVLPFFSSLCRVRLVFRIRRQPRLGHAGRFLPCPLSQASCCRCCRCRISPPFPARSPVLSPLQFTRGTHHTPPPHHTNETDNKNKHTHKGGPSACVVLLLPC
jgi:hypothetical protein